MTLIFQVIQESHYQYLVATPDSIQIFVIIYLHKNEKNVESYVLAMQCKYPVDYCMKDYFVGYCENEI